MPKIETDSVVWYADKKPSPRGKYMRVASVERDDSRPDSENQWGHHAFEHQPSANPAAYIQRQDVLKWFHQSDQNDVEWVLNRLMETAPNLVNLISAKTEDAIPETPIRFRTSMRAQEGALRLSAIVANPGAYRELGEPIIQFASAVFFAEEGTDNIMVLDVMRIGNQSGVSEVFYETEDDSALHGRSYLPTSGKLVFNPGESLQHIEVAIIDNPLWDTTTEFKCTLKEEGLRGATLGHYLYHTRVKIIDSNCFPTGDFEHLLGEEEVIKCNKWKLLRGFMSMASNIPTVWNGTVKAILVDAFHNLVYLMELFMSVYILDYILDTSDDAIPLLIFPDKLESLIFCCFITVVCFAVAHVLDYMRMSFTLLAPARNFLQRALLRKFLNYTNEVRELLQPGRVMVGMERDVIDLVLEGYVNTLKIVKATGKMVLMLCFKLLSPVVFGGDYDWHSCLLLIVIPVVVMAFLQVRETTTSRCLQHRNNCHSALTNQIATTTTNFHLVLDYSLRNHCEHVFNHVQQEYGAAAMHAAQVNENNVYFCKWCQAMLITIWTVYGGLCVISGSVTIGLFATNLQLFKAFGNEFLELYALTVSMMHTFPALEHVTTLMNFPTDVKQRYKLEKHQRHVALAQRDELRAKLEESGNRSIPVDIMPIVLNFDHPFKFEGKDQSLNFMGRVEVHQGQLLAVVGSMGCGKATLLRLIAGSVLPSSNLSSPIFVPSHLRVANVADEPLFFGGTLYDNLIFGMDEGKPDASRERVQAICRRLTKSNIIVDYLDVHEERRWQDIFSGAQCKLLSIARALIHNAEVLCIHKPLVKLNDHDAEYVITALHDHVEWRGLELYSDAQKRRPRTVILSAATDRILQEAHNVIQIDARTGIKLHSDED